MSKAKRVTMSISESLQDKAKFLMRERDIDEFSGYVHQLIREDWDARGKEVVERRLQDLRAAVEGETDRAKAQRMMREIIDLRRWNQSYPAHEDQFSTAEETSEVPPSPPEKGKLTRRPAKLKPDTKN